MIGSNEILLNTASIIEAVQEYLNKRAVGVTLKVTNIEFQDTYTGKRFKVTVNGGKPAE